MGRVLGGWFVVRVVMIAVPLSWRASQNLTTPGIARVEPAFQPAGERVAGVSALSAAAVASAPIDHVNASGATPPLAPFQTADGSEIAGVNAASGRAAGAPVRASFAFSRQNARGGGLDLALYPPGVGLAAASPFSPSGQDPKDDRWSATGWLLWRPAGAGVPTGGGQLGGSQAGVRVDYALAQMGGARIAVYGRASAALRTFDSGEAAAGLSLKPLAAAPVSFAVERRQRLSEGGRNAFAAYAAGGLGPRSIGAGLDVDGYGQIGVVGLAKPDGFLDGKVSVMGRVSAPASSIDLSLGASVSGGAQPGVSRLDVGPELRLRLPFAPDRMRLSAEWRQRVAGDASPPSGPAITLIAAF